MTTTTRTLEALGARYLREQQPRTKPTTHAEEARLWRATILPALGAARPLAELALDLEADELGPVAAWHAGLFEAPYIANRALGSLSRAFALAERLRWLPRGSNPCPTIRRYAERPRLVYPDAAQLVRLDEALAALQLAGTIGESSADAIEAVRLTGCRKGEILRLAWLPGIDRALGWVDLEAELLRYRDSKGGPKLVPMNRRTLELFRRRAHARGSSPWCFPGRNPAAPLAGLQRAWERACELAGIAGACVHSLRHSFATRGLEAGIELKAMQGLLGHSDVRSTLRYQHPTVEAMRAATNRLDAVSA